MPMPPCETHTPLSSFLSFLFSLFPFFFGHFPSHWQLSLWGASLIMDWKKKKKKERKKEKHSEPRFFFFDFFHSIIFPHFLSIQTPFFWFLLIFFSFIYFYHHYYYFLLSSHHTHFLFIRHPHRHYQSPPTTARHCRLTIWPSIVLKKNGQIFFLLYFIFIFLSLFIFLVCTVIDLDLGLLLIGY